MNAKPIPPATWDMWRWLVLLAIVALWLEWWLYYAAARAAASGGSARRVRRSRRAIRDTERLILDHDAETRRDSEVPESEFCGQVSE